MPSILVDLDQYALPGLRERSPVLTQVYRGKAVSPIDDVVEFYISPSDYLTSRVRDWMVYAESPYRCFGVFGDVAQATEKAMHMAAYRVTCGKEAQVHLQKGDGSPWQTVWCSPDTPPRFPSRRTGEN